MSEEESQEPPRPANSDDFREVIKLMRENNIAKAREILKGMFEHHRQPILENTNVFDMTKDKVFFLYRDELRPGVEQILDDFKCIKKQDIDCEVVIPIHKDATYFNNTSPETVLSTVFGQARVNSMTPESIDKFKKIYYPRYPSVGGKKSSKTKKYMGKKYGKTKRIKRKIKLIF
jgi:hypothetical protein